MQSNRLTVLAADIKDKLAASSAAELSAIDLAMAAGASLNEARSVCAHGEWLPFLEAAGVPERKAQRYMRLARSGLKSDTVSDLGGIKAALRWLEQARMPADQEVLIVTDRVARGVTIVSRGGPGFLIVNLAEPFIDTLRRPIIKSEAEAVLPTLFCLFDYRCKDLDFIIVPGSSPAVSQIGDPFERWILALLELPPVESSAAVAS